MDLRQLTTFRTVATTLSFTRAAAALNYVQSSVTAQIQSLEEELGVQLFDRLGKRVALTDAGERLLPYAERLLDLADEARGVVAEAFAPSGTLVISAPETLCTYRLPQVLRAYRSQYPEVALHLRPGLSGDLRRAMPEGRVDVAFLLEEPMQSSGLLAETLLTEPLLLLAAPDHRLATLPSVCPADFQGETVVLTESGCGYRALLDRSLVAAGVQPGTILEFSSVEAIKQCVMAGMGATILPAIAVQAEVVQNKLAALTWTEGDLYAVTRVVVHRDKWLSPALRAFLEVTREVLSEPVNAAGVA
ncbi:MAG TPA: LysR family transcriptional regulator [Chloroflexota bacterium]